MWTLKKLISVCLFVAALLLVSGTAMAEENVQIEVRAIAATSNGEDCDRSLRRLCGRLQRGFGAYSNFQLVDRSELRLSSGESGEVRLPTGHNLTMEFQGLADEFVKLGLSIDDRLSTTLRASPGSTFFQAGLNYREGILILAITVR